MEGQMRLNRSYVMDRFQVFFFLQRCLTNFKHDRERRGEGGCKELAALEQNRRGTMQIGGEKSWDNITVKAQV